MPDPNLDPKLIAHLLKLEQMRVTDYDYVREREASLLRGVTRGAAVATPLHTLVALREKIEAEPGSLVVVSDVHGQLEILQHVLSELGLVSAGVRTNRASLLVSIGDLIDGRNKEDEQTLWYGLKVFDTIVAGNHEVAFMGGRRFAGQPHHDEDGLGELLREAASAHLLRAHVVFGDVLITHAGINRHFARRSPITLLDSELSSAWQRFLKRPRDQTLGMLTGPSSKRSRVELSEQPGCFWQDWSELLSSAPRQFRQIVGHSPRGRIEVSLDRRLYNIDAAGARLGIAVVTPRGEIHVGSDYIPPAL